MQVAQAEAGVVGVAGDPAGLVLAVDDQDPLDAEPAQLDGRGQAGRPSPHDQHVDVGGLRHRDGPGRLRGPLGGLTPSTSVIDRPVVSANRAATSPVQ